MTAPHEIRPCAGSAPGGSRLERDAPVSSNAKLGRGLRPSAFFAAVSADDLSQPRRVLAPSPCRPAGNSLGASASGAFLPAHIAAALDALGVREPRQPIERQPAPVQTWDGKGECPW